MFFARVGRKLEVSKEERAEGEERKDTKSVWIQWVTSVQIKKDVPCHDGDG